MSERPSPVRTAVVLGGSHTGMLAARALVRFADRVIVVERDALPAGPEPRKGLPQARHAHMLWSGGMRAVENLLPGITGSLRDAGAHRLPVTTDMVVLGPRGWFRRWAESHHVVLSGRDLLDATIRARVLSDDRIEVVERTEAVGLVGTGRADAGAGTADTGAVGVGGAGAVGVGGAGTSARNTGVRITGVRIRPHGGPERTVAAELVVDASGRGSAAPRWLAEFGLPEPERREVDSGLAYASRLYLAPEQARDGFPVVNVQSDPRDAGPGRAGFLLPIEDGRWIVTLCGTRGGQPPTDEEEFLRFARQELRHPVIGELIERAEPLSGVSFTRTTVNRRYFYERMPVWPENFVVIGDALAAFNPVYGHGMAAAAQSAVLLRDVIGRHGWGTPGLARRLQKAVARPIDAAWELAVGQDVFYPGATERGPTLRDRLVSAYVGRLMYTATGNGRIARRVTDVTSLERGAEVLLTPSVLLAAAVGPHKPPLGGPPLTALERKAAGLP
ncbi:NAD(P)/FAD-dependent oxidoreductase [Streptomyces bullii]|uniref:NAD(P)/FAD-dependent oxidoreductase n=1 Tax=Streptomyces bullii TaxID=349910 RepID=A0ABW0UJG8_9ACTN